MSDTARLIRAEGLPARLDMANGRRRTRIMDIDDVLAGVERAEKVLDQWQIPLRMRPGISVMLTSGHRLPNSYGSLASETRVSLVRRATGWEVVDVMAGYVPKSRYGDGPDRYLTRWRVSQDAADWMTRHLLTSRGITIEPLAGEEQ